MWLIFRVPIKYIFEHPVYTALNYTYLQISQSVNVCNHTRKPHSQRGSACPPILLSRDGLELKLQRKLMT